MTDHAQEMIDIADVLAGCGYLLTVTDVRTFVEDYQKVVAERDSLSRLVGEQGQALTTVVAERDALIERVRELETALQKYRGIPEDWVSEELVRMFLGWLSGDIAELRTFEVPKLAESWERFKCVVYDDAAPPSSGSQDAAAGGDER